MLHLLRGLKMVIIEPMERESRTAFKERYDTINKVNEIINVVNGKAIYIGDIETLDVTISDNKIILPEIKTGIYFITLGQGTFIIDIKETDIASTSNVCLFVGTHGTYYSFYYLEFGIENDNGILRLNEINVTTIEQPPTIANISIADVKRMEYVIPEGD